MIVFIEVHTHAIEIPGKNNSANHGTVCTIGLFVDVLKSGHLSDFFVAGFQPFDGELDR